MEALRVHRCSRRMEGVWSGRFSSRRAARPACVREYYVTTIGMSTLERHAPPNDHVPNSTHLVLLVGEER